MKRLLFYILLIVIITTIRVSAQEIGASWEFNEDGNNEGWEANSSLSELVIENGLLKTTVTGSQPGIVSPDINLSASDYGFILIRMKAAGAGVGKLFWKTDSYSSKYITVEITNDSLFHDYEIPVHTNKYWTGTILKINKIGLVAPVGTEFIVDFIRIISIGPRFDIDFKPYRTVLKRKQEIPVAAIITNSGDKELVDYSVEFELPEGSNLIEGELFQQVNSLHPSDSDTIVWKIYTPDTGTVVSEVRLSAASADSLEKSFQADVVDKYWVQDDFILSAWSPPGQTEEAYNEYSAANFDLIAYCNPDVAVVDFITQQEMECMLNVGSYISGDIRAPGNAEVAPITDDDLAGLDPIIQMFLNNPTPIGYHICDEPNAYAFPNLEKIVSYLRERDPERVAFINLFPTYASEEQLGNRTYDRHVRQYVEIVKPELISYDHYNFFVENRDGVDYFQNLEIIRKYAVLYDIPFCNIIQAINSQVRTDVWRKLHIGEYRWLVYSSLAYGAKGIMYFAWSGSYGIMTSPEKDEAYAAIQSLNSEIKQLGPILLELKSTGVHHLNQVPPGCPGMPDDCLVHSVSLDSDLLVGFFVDSGGNSYMMLMNKDYNEVTSTNVTLNRYVDYVEYLNVETGNWQNVEIDQATEGTTFDFDFLPGGGALFKIGQTISIDQIADIENNSTFVLEKNYPNPFNPSTTIRYSLPQATKVKLTVYDVIGREIAVLVNEKQNSGDYSIVWEAQNIPSGLYVYRFEAGFVVQNRKMLLLK